MTSKQKTAVKRMVEQFIVAAELKYKITDPTRLETVMRGSILKKRSDILEYAIAYMKTLR
ncbi:MAG: hypothetical protein M1426_00130 [Patescibacteria group bacterium]|nr:hypothetical protein [Patescibacteria group bacterium]